MGKQSPPPDLWLGKVSRIVNGQLYLSIPHFHPLQEFGPAIYLGSHVFAQGDACMVGFLEGDRSRPAILSP